MKSPTIEKIYRKKAKRLSRISQWSPLAIFNAHAILKSWRITKRAMDLASEINCPLCTIAHAFLRPGGLLRYGIIGEVPKEARG
jgi:hypothetical protein